MKHHLLLMAIGLLLSPFMSAQAQLQKNVLASGATMAQNNNIQLQATVGQAAIGTSTSASDTALSAGFWYTVLSNSTDVVEIEGPLPTGFEVGDPYPNPARDIVYLPVALDQATRLTVTLTDMNGRTLGILFNESLGSGHYAFECTTVDYPSGSYWLVISTGEQVRTRMIIRE